MENTKLTRGAAVADKVLKLLQGFALAGVIVAAIFIPLTLILGTKIIANASGLDLGVLELTLRGNGLDYLDAGGDRFLRVDPEYAIAGELYVNRKDLPMAQRCLKLLAGPPIPVDGDALEEAYDEYMEQAPGQEEDLTTGDGAWKVFLVLAFILLAAIFGPLLW